MWWLWCVVVGGGLLAWFVAFHSVHTDRSSFIVHRAGFATMCERLSARASRWGDAFDNRVLLMVAWVFYPFYPLPARPSDFGLLCLLVQHPAAEFMNTINRHLSAVSALALFIASAMRMAVPQCLPAGVFNSFAERFGVAPLTEHVFVAAQHPRRRRKVDANMGEDERQCVRGGGGGGGGCTRQWSVV